MIYLECYNYEFLEPQINRSLSKIETDNQFYDIIFNTLQKHCKKITTNLLKKIYKVFPSQLLIDEICSNNSYPENNRLEHCMAQYITQEALSNNPSQFLSIVFQFYESFKIIEYNSIQVKKIVQLYNEQYLRKESGIKFNQDFYIKIYTFYVYNDPLIKKYLGLVGKLFSATAVISKYPDKYFYLQEIQKTFTKK